MHGSLDLANKIIVHEARPMAQTIPPLVLAWSRARPTCRASPEGTRP
jgi:hypothetical protein